MEAALLLGLALAADAFAVALVQGACAGGKLHRTALIVGGAFGFAQGVMPLLGWAVGAVFVGAVESFDHWIAFAILVLLGAKLLKEALERGDDTPPRRATGWTLVLLALATSVDAAAAGLTFEALGLPPLAAALTIGAVTALLCALGVYMGRSAAGLLGKAAEALGGVALIGIGVKILLDHGALHLGA